MESRTNKPNKQGFFERRPGLTEIREKNRARVARWRKAHPEKSRAITARYRKAHPDRVRASENDGADAYDSATGAGCNQAAAEGVRPTQ
jgi:hypothetical protein